MYVIVLYCKSREFPYISFHVRFQRTLVAKFLYDVCFKSNRIRPTILYIGNTGFPNGNREQITKEYFLEDKSITMDQKWKYRWKLILSNFSVEKNIYLVQS